MSHVVVIGGGNGGITTAARLVRDGFEVSVVEPRETHVYRPLLSFVGAGRAPLEAAVRDQATTIPDGCRWIRDQVISVDPRSSAVRLAGGTELHYDQLVLASGMEADWRSCPGLAEALLTDFASSNFITDLAPKTWRLVQALRSGTALFTLPPGPASNGGSALKALFMSCDYWRSAGRLGDIKPMFVTATSTVFGIPEVDDRIAGVLADYGVSVVTESVITSVSAEERVARLSTHGGSGEDVPFSFAHFVPPYRPAGWIAESGLSDDQADGFVAVDPRTLRHRRWPDVWALGDVAGTPSSKSGAAIRKQAPVLAANLAAVDRGGEPTEQYDGYSAAPIALSRRSLALFEFDEAYRPAPSTRLVDLTKPRRLAWLFDRYGFPQVYWRRILRGKA